MFFKQMNDDLDEFSHGYAFLHHKIDISTVHGVSTYAWLIQVHSNLSHIEPHPQGKDPLDFCSYFREKGELKGPARGRERRDYLPWKSILWVDWYIHLALNN